MKLIISIIALLMTGSAFALTTGQMAPDFKLKAASGRELSLSDFKGKIVVLEWLNHGCPFVRKHYDSGNMQSLQKKYTGQNAIWFSIVSSASGKQGFVAPSEAKAEMVKNKSSATDVLLDPDGAVGKLYEAKTTPHMFIVDKEGKLAYQGAIDDKPDTEISSVPGARNFVAQALDEMMASKKITSPQTKSYGCSVKY